MIDHRKSFHSEYTSRQSYYRKFLHGPIEQHTLEFMRLLGERSYKAIVVYPEAVMWEPQQRPQHLLKQLAKQGYLCLFCETSDGQFRLQELEPNLFVVHGEAFLISALRSQAVIVLCTWVMQMAWADLLPHKILWYDQLDSLDFFSLHDESMNLKHEQVLRMSEIVTYSAQKLRHDVGLREDAVYLPNAVNVDDFRIVPDPCIPAELEPLVASGSPIIGYYGALEEWFDTDLIRRIALRRPDWQFVLIGRSSIAPERLAAPNVHLLGFKPYEQLAAYARYFHAAIIPFAVTGMTNSISPVKFFEYAALGLPVISTPIAEMVPFRSDWVRLADRPEAFENAIEISLKPETRWIAKEKGIAFASGQTWSNRIDTVERQLRSRPNVWKAYANYDAAGKVAVMSATFLDYDGERFYSGGAERYLIDLSRLCKVMGLDLVIYQYGNYPWLRRFKGIDVVSLSRGGQHARDYSVASVRTFSRLFREQTEARAPLTMFSAYFNAWPHATASSIGIIHGVCWDNPASRFQEGASFWEHNRRFIEGAQLCKTLVSVDTNSPNWFQTIDYELGQRIQTIPNYVDAQQFNPRPDFENTQNPLIILYPRRLYSPRGLYMVLDIVDRILEQYPHVAFHFVGNGDPEDEENVKHKIIKWGDRIRCYALPMEKMDQAYRQADISLIPTLYSEGTSLSCLEAMACGNAVIATRIGGLPDLVIHNYNGLLIEPNADALVDALRSLLDQPGKLALLKRRAVEVAGVFAKRRWEEQWWKVIQANMAWSPKERQLPSARRLLIELYVGNASMADEVIGKTIVDLLSQGHLIYLRIQEFLYAHTHSFGRLQWMNWKSAAHDIPDIVMADERVRSDVGSPLDVVLNREGEWEWISSYRPLHIERVQR